MTPDIDLLYPKLFLIESWWDLSQYERSTNDANQLGFWIWKFWWGLGKVYVEVRRPPTTSDQVVVYLYLGKYGR